MNFFNKNKKIKKNGFSLIELLVVVALLGVMTTITLLNYNSFGREIELENSAHSLALAIREVQNYGINRKAREDGLGTVAEIKGSFGETYGYGVYFTKLEASSTREWDNKNFIFYRDSIVGSDKSFNEISCGVIETTTSTEATECFSKVKIGKGNKIHSLKAGGTNTANEVNSINLYFERPEPDAEILVSPASTSKNSLEIKITDSSETYFFCIKVGNAGDISVKKCSI